MYNIFGSPEPEILFPQFDNGNRRPFGAEEALLIVWIGAVQNGHVRAHLHEQERLAFISFLERTQHLDEASRRRETLRMARRM